ncbi:MAG: bifunctional oligoribonuclease/PAP phosphatase NrnA [Chitinophagaceae bacterium]|nr:bifunctional oligoribonuclease/PAP phosphatase NrnA [Chitinophagaceae bacterium]
MNVNNLQKIIVSSQTVIITMHANPDSDALGSSLALSIYLEKKGCEVFVISPTGYPDFLKWMGGSNSVIIFSKETENRVRDIFLRGDVIFCLDFNCYERLHNLESFVKSSPAKKVVIDHHLYPNIVADFIISDPSKSSTSELLYDIMVSLGDEGLVDLDMAENIYGGLIGDTGNFRNSNTTVAVHFLAARLIQKGVVPHKIIECMYESGSMRRLQFLGYVLSECSEFLVDTIIFTIKKEVLQRFDSQMGDTEGIVNYGLTVEGVICSILVVEKVDRVKISFRSKNNFSVYEMARDIFGGGGHNYAAGATSFVNVEETVTKIKNFLRCYRKS